MEIFKEIKNLTLEESIIFFISTLELHEENSKGQYTIYEKKIGLKDLEEKNKELEINEKGNYIHKNKDELLRLYVEFINCPSLYDEIDNLLYFYYCVDKETNQRIFVSISFLIDDNKIIEMNSNFDSNFKEKTDEFNNLYIFEIEDGIKNVKFSNCYLNEIKELLGFENYNKLISYFLEDNNLKLKNVIERIY